METIQTKMLKATKPIQDEQSTPVFKTDDIGAGAINDQFHTITEKVAEDIKEALSSTSPTFDASHNSMSSTTGQKKDDNE